eukprot:scaffold8096_cov1613-Prasinococcus_capsulatus_cf.AAC.9
MGSNMQRQAVPLLELERPIVGTGLEEQVVLDSGAVEAKQDIIKEGIYFKQDEELFYKKMNG